MIEIKNVSKIFKSKEAHVDALKNVTLTIDKGDIFGIIGYSGAGKSTLLRCINGLEVPTSGEVLLLGQDITQLKEKELRHIRKKIGMIFQHFNLMHSKTVFENIAYPLKSQKLSKSTIADRVKALLRLVDLEDKVNSYPSQLSGGQKQRVAIARALATNPEILLCDEATSALDPQTTQSILALLKKINKELGITIVLITHQMEVIKEICNKIAVMEHGCVLEVGQLIDVYTNPQSQITQDFLAKDMHFERLSLPHEDEIAKMLHLKYIGSSTGSPLISALSQHFKVTANITFGNIEKLQDILVGNLVIDLHGSEEEVQKALDYIRQHIEVEVIDDERIITRTSA
ncbi:MAG: methionine ABC transporter ATP-binding protein [Clostridiales bacterium]|jgi:D-methionine transport system ATP-binding protein|nr:methionine ABC transporter ATP-binding protein [Clostridiales bacterium]